MVEKEEEAELLEKLAEFEYEQWCDEPERCNTRWKGYSTLSKEFKEEYRERARGILKIIKKNHILLSNHDLTDEERQTAKDASNIFR